MTDAAYEPELFGRLDELEERSSWFKERSRLILWALGKQFPHARTFVEAGCGTGIVLQAVEARGLTVTGVELYHEGAPIPHPPIPNPPIALRDPPHFSPRP